MALDDISHLDFPTPDPEDIGSEEDSPPRHTLCADPVACSTKLWGFFFPLINGVSIVNLGLIHLLFELGHDEEVYSFMRGDRNDINLSLEAIMETAERVKKFYEDLYE